SKWSKINAGKAAELINSGRMRPAGRREVEQAQADGRWEVPYEGQRTITVPEDLRRALAGNDAAREFFATLSGVNRYAILYRIGSVKRPETRARKIAQYVAMLAGHRTIYPRTRPPVPEAPLAGRAPQEIQAPQEIRAPLAGLPQAVVLVTGIQAAGKSTVAQLLAARLPRSVHLRGDIFRKMIVSGRADMTPDPADQAVRQLRLRHRLTAAVADAYFEANG